QGFVFFPGGYGTLDEVFEVITLIQTGKLRTTPVIFYGSEYWGGLVEWIKQTLLAGGFISPGDEALFKVLDDIEEVAATMIGLVIKANNDVVIHDQMTNKPE